MSCRASASFMKAMSTRFRTSLRASGLPSIQKFMVSQTVSVGFSTWDSTCSCSSGSMLARKTYLACL